MLRSLYRTKSCSLSLSNACIHVQIYKGITSCCMARSVCILLIGFRVQCCFMAQPGYVLQIQGMSELTWLAFSSAGLKQNTHGP